MIMSISRVFRGMQTKVAGDSGRIGVVDIQKPLVLMLTDFRGLIPQRIMAWDGYDLARIGKILTDSGADVAILGVHEFDFSLLRGRKHVAAIYASSQEPRYKQYLQAVVSNLHFYGARLYPSLEHMMAHEDKAYQAMKLASTSISAPHSYVYGNKEQAYRFLGNAVYPLVGKSPDGSGSKGVLLIKNERDGRAFIDQHMVHRALRKGRPFIVRAFQRIFKPRPVLGLVVFHMTPNLKGDWKILMWGDKACGVYRENRPKTFRASGSGKVHFVEIPSHILDFAMEVLEKLDLPWGSLDIGFTAEKCLLLEYQGLHFGLTAADRSSFYFRKVNGKWEKMEGKIPIETEMANIILEDICPIGLVDGE